MQDAYFDSNTIDIAYLSNALPDPWAVMIKAFHTVVANGTV
jgi:hypothetical protein